MRSPVIRKDEWDGLPRVVYWQTLENGRKDRIFGCCFGSLVFRKTTSVTYKCPIGRGNDYKLSREACLFYVDFLNRLLKRNGCPEFTMKVGRTVATITIATKDLPYKRMLLFLTLFRYIHHYSPLVAKLYEKCGERRSTQATFGEFRRLHHDIRTKKLLIDPDVHWEAEMALSTYYGEPKKLSLSSFWKKLASEASKQGLTRVQDHF